jgi:RNA-directed DNA polymerase
MDGNRRKTPEQPTLWEDAKGEASSTDRQGTETPVASRETESPAKPEFLMEEVVERDNTEKAPKRVMANRGSPGVDGMRAHELPGRLAEDWSEIRQQLLNGTYHPSPVRRVEIPKPNGGKRPLGIPTVLDRLVQQARAQVLTPVFDPDFSDESYGFRPGRSAQQAVARAQGYMEEGHSRRSFPTSIRMIWTGSLRNEDTASSATRMTATSMWQASGRASA